MKAVLGGTLALAVAIGAAGAAAERQELELRPDCEISVGVEAVAIQADPVTVPIRHTAAVGDSIAASFPEESNVKVVSVGREDEDEALTLRVVLNTSEAAAGEWPLTVRGTEGECRGTVNVVATEAEGR